MAVQKKLIADEPKTMEIEYRETVFVCSNGAHDVRAVYLWRGAWRCLPCTKVAMRQQGANSLQVACCAGPGFFDNHPAEFRIEAVRRSEGVRRITQLRDRPPLSPLCEMCGKKHREGFCEL